MVGHDDSQPTLPPKCKDHQVLFIYLEGMPTVAEPTQTNNCYIV